MDPAVKALALIGVVALPLMVFIATILSVCFPALLIGGCIVYGGVYGFLPMVCLGPLGVIVAREVFIRSLSQEVDLIDQVGAHKALWYEQTTPSYLVGGHFTRPAYTAIAWWGHDISLQYVRPINDALGCPLSEEVIGEGVIGMASLAWSAHVKFLHGLVHSKVDYYGIVTMIAIAVWWCLRLFGRFSVRLVHLYVLLCWVVIVTPSEKVSKAVWFSLRLVVRVWRLVADPLALEYAQWAITVFFVDLALATQGVSVSVRRTYSEALSNRKLSGAARLRRTVLDTVKIITDVGLPSYVRTRFKISHSVEALEASKQLMADIGWPVNVSHTSPVHVEGASNQYEDWLVTGTDFRTGLSQMKTYVGERMDLLAASALQYKRTEEYQSVANELESTARYFQHKDIAFPNLPIDDVWFVLRDIFKHSRLTPFNVVIAAWQKKYALGFYMRDPVRRKAKYKRRTFINTMGYQNFKALWARTFYYATMILPVAHVSVKGEALPEKKWILDKVRSVIGSPLGHYIATSFFAYGPNHRFAWETTPIKVGMPLNGHHMGTIFGAHAKRQHHAQGDFTAFDSSLEGGVKDIIREIRKRGYEHHKDRHRICDLIDCMYDLLDGSLLGMTTTGNVYRKGTGLTTGHSSTTMDNSTALVALYIMAWKELTGLSAREFLSYNELSCYGDDHIISFSTVRPLSWSFRNIQKVMGKWGVQNNLDEGPLGKMSFLKKWSSKPDGADVQLFRSLGMRTPTFKVWHDKPSLVGKLTARVKNLNPTYRLNRLMSYLELTAHHEDVYKSIVAIITTSTTMMHHLKVSKRKIPTYGDIVRGWYQDKGGPAGLDEDDYGLVDERLVLYGTPTYLDNILNFVAMVPDFLNPAIFNTGFMRTAQVQLGPTLSWAVNLIIRQNDVVSNAHFRKVVSRTPYEFLESSLYSSVDDSCNLSSMLVRHWIYLGYLKLRPVIPRWVVGDMLIRKVAAIQFMVNAKVQLELPSTDLSLDKLLIVALLSYLPVPNFLDFVGLIHLPDVGLFLDLAFNRLLSLLWGAVPSNYREVHELLKKPRGTKVLLEAGTGTGKSTDFVYSTWHNFSHKFRKVVVVEPRVLLATGLAPYVSKRFGIWANAGTGASPLDLRANIVYVTEGTFLNHLDAWKSDFLYILDECHIASHQAAIIRRFIEVKQASVVAMSATPRPEDFAWADLSVQLNAASLWKVEMREVNFSGPPAKYISLARDFVSSLSIRDKVAVILDTPEAAMKFSMTIDRESQVLSSKHSPVVRNVPLYCTTNVIDVGVTIPDLDYIIFPNWDYAGDGARHEVTRSLIAQRKGRVGRTRNGVAVMFCTDATLKAPLRGLPFNKDSAKDMMLSGVSPLLASLLGQSAVLEALELSFTNQDEDNKEEILKDIGIFMENFRPLMVAMSMQPDDITGNYVHIRPTGMGISSTAKEVDQHSLVPIIWSAVKGVAKKLTGVELDEDNEAALKTLAKTPGTNVFTQDLFSWLQDKTGTFPSVNSLSGGLKPTWSDTQEIIKIYSLLKEVNELA